MCAVGVVTSLSSYNRHTSLSESDNVTHVCCAILISVEIIFHTNVITQRIYQIKTYWHPILSLSLIISHLFASNSLVSHLCLYVFSTFPQLVLTWTVLVSFSNNNEYVEPREANCASTCANQVFGSDGPKWWEFDSNYCDTWLMLSFSWHSSWSMKCSSVLSVHQLRSYDDNSSHTK